MNRPSRVQLIPPGAALRPFLDAWVAVTFTAAVDDHHLPETGLRMAFCVRGACVAGGFDRAAGAVLTGMQSKLRRHRHGRGNHMLIAAFKPGAAAAFFRESLDALAENSVDLRELWRRDTADLREQIAEAADDVQRVQLIERRLLRQLRSTAVDPLCAAAITRIENTGGAIRMAELARQIGLSQSALERRFRRHVGTTPRQYASIVRWRRVERLHRSGLDLTAIAHEAGYFDQAHFIHDFRAMAGCAPAAFFARS